MKAILMSIRPEWVAKILNGEKTIEIRKKFPKDYVGWVYIYCTAEDKNGYLIRNRSTKKCEFTYNGFVKSVCWSANRKVIARFWCDKVEKIRSYLEPEQWYMTSDLGGSGLLKKSCLTFKELDDYLLSGEGYAIHITKLVIFDKPKEINEFFVFSHIANGVDAHNQPKQFKILKPLTRAPQSWCYIED